MVAGFDHHITNIIVLTRNRVATAFAAVQYSFGLLVSSFHRIRKDLCSNRRLLMINRAKTIEAQVATIWEGPLSKLQALIVLAGERLKLGHAELEETCKGNWTNVYDLIRIGYKCIQTCTAVHLLCAKGFPDQALPLCRSLMEQEANLGFILTIENKEEVIQRFLDWEKAKFYRYVKSRKDRLDRRSAGPTEEEWDSLTREYERLKVKYEGKGDLDKLEQWAIGTRAQGAQNIKAFSVKDRARQSIPRLLSDETQLHDAWTSQWQRLNEFSHTTPRSIVESASSYKQNVLVIGRSPYGLDEPIMIAGKSILNISSALTDIVATKLPGKGSQRSEELGNKAMEVFREVSDELNHVPAEVAPWWHSDA